MKRTIAQVAANGAVVLNRLGLGLGEWLDGGYESARG